MAQFYRQAESESGLDEFRTKNPMPIRIYEYVALKDGCLYRFDTIKKAQAVSRLIESIWINRDEYKDWSEKYTKLQNQTNEIWRKKLFDYHGIAKPLFDIAMSRAYDRGHSAGYEEVESILEDEVEYIEKIMKTIKETSE